MVATFKGFSPEQEVSWSVSETPYSIGGSVTPDQAIGDFVADVTTGSTSDNNCKLTIAPSPVTGISTVTNDTPTVCSFDVTTGAVTRLLDGTCALTIASPGSKKKFTRAMLRAGGVDVYDVKSWAAGSLTRHINDQIDAMLAGKTPGSDTQYLFSSAVHNYAAPSGTRNPSIFSGSLDLAAFSFTRSGSAVKYPVALISDRHFICATHVGVTVGQTIVWLDNAGDFKSATVVSISNAGIASDTSVGYLSTAITGITPASFLPSTRTTYLPKIPNVVNYGQVTHPVLMNLWDDATNQRKLHVGRQARKPVSYSNDSIAYDSAGYIAPSGYAGWSSKVQGGDSSSPVFIPVDDGAVKTVLLGCMWQAGITADYADVLANITSAMQSLAQSAGDPSWAGYAPLTVSLAGFTAY